MKIKSCNIWERIQYMKDHTLISKFVGVWPSEKALFWWINTTCKPHGTYDLELGSKGFFTVIFFNLEDRDQIFVGGPYLFYFVGLLLKPCKEIFCPDKGDLRIAPFWI